MFNGSRLYSVLAATVAVVLSASASASADPVVPAALPDVPSPPSVVVTPGDNGVGVGVGTGGTGVQVGAGPGGVSLGVGSDSTSPTPSSNRAPGTPVQTPTAQPTKRAVTSPSGTNHDGGGSAGESASTGSTAADGHSDGGAGPDQTRSFPTRHPEPVETAAQQAADREPDSKLPPVLEFVDRIPLAFKGALIALGLIALALWGVWVKDRRRLSSNAFIDPLTGVANTAAFTRLLDGELDRAKRYKRPLGLLLLDVSEGEQNDGKLLRLRDTTLRTASEAISERIREADNVARLGQSRFAVMSPEATGAATETLARALELRLEELRIHVKVGVAEREATDQSAADLLARAEAAMPGGRGPRPQARPAQVLRAA
jgi:diguanylate cyclase (GGDEF)-like protein